jgi:hypothetical protein
VKLRQKLLCKAFQVNGKVPSGAHFVDFWSQSRKMLKSSLLELILSTSGSKAGKCSNRGFWNSFCVLLEPRLENAQIEPSGAHFVDFWSQGWKMLKSSLLQLIWSTSGAKAGKYIKSSLLELILYTSGAHVRKCPNRAFWSSFCQLLEPRLAHPREMASKTALQGFSRSAK